MFTTLGGLPVYSGKVKFTNFFQTPFLKFHSEVYTIEMFVPGLLLVNPSYCFREFLEVKDLPPESNLEVGNLLVENL